MRAVSESDGEGADCSDPDDSDRSVASIGLVLRTPAVGGNAIAPPAAPAVKSAPPADSDELGPWAEAAAESNDPGSTCTMTVPSALDEIWLPT